MGWLIIYPPQILCFSEEEDQNWSSTEVRSKQFPQRLLKTLTTISSPCLSSYKVLPAIGMSVTGEELELSPSQSVNTTYPILRNYSDGYLVQMEKQKQQKARVTYKVGVSVCFMCTLNGGILNVHIFSMLYNSYNMYNCIWTGGSDKCCEAFREVLCKRKSIYHLPSQYLYPCDLIWDVKHKRY